MAKRGSANGWTTKIVAAGITFFVGYNFWIGASIVDLCKQVARVETKIDMMMRTDGTD